MRKHGHTHFLALWRPLRTRNTAFCSPLYDLGTLSNPVVMRPGNPSIVSDCQNFFVIVAFCHKCIQKDNERWIGIEMAIHSSAVTRLRLDEAETRKVLERQWLHGYADMCAEEVALRKHTREYLFLRGYEAKRMALESSLLTTLSKIVLVGLEAALRKEQEETARDELFSLRTAFHVGRSKLQAGAIVLYSPQRLRAALLKKSHGGRDVGNSLIGTSPRAPIPDLGRCPPDDRAASPLDESKRRSLAVERRLNAARAYGTVAVSGAARQGDLVSLERAGNLCHRVQEALRRGGGSSWSGPSYRATIDGSETFAAALVQRMLQTKSDAT